MKAVYSVKNQITIMKITDTYMPTLLTKVLQSQYIVSLNENDSLHKEKVYERNPNYKIYDRLDQVKSILTAVKGGVLSGVPLINEGNFYVCISGKNVQTMGSFFIKLSLIIRKDIGKEPLVYAT